MVPLALSIFTCYTVISFKSGTITVCYAAVPSYLKCWFACHLKCFSIVRLFHMFQTHVSFGFQCTLRTVRGNSFDCIIVALPFVSLSSIKIIKNMWIQYGWPSGRPHFGRKMVNLYTENINIFIKCCRCIET